MITNKEADKKKSLQNTNLTSSKIKKIQGGYVSAYILLFISLCLIYSFVPYTDDDLRWGSAEGQLRWNQGFDKYGGRYFGYLIVTVMTRSTPIKVIIMAAVTTLLIFLMQKIVKEWKVSFVTGLLLMLLPTATFSQTISWVSGFANYMTSVTFTLIFVWYIYRRIDDDNRPRIPFNDSIPFALGFLILGFLNALIVEHFTILNIVLGAFMVIYTWVKERKFAKAEWAYLFGTIAGALWMFSNSAYRNIAKGNDWYRSVSDQSTAEKMKQGLALIIKYGFVYYDLLISIIFVVLLIVLIHKYASLRAFEKTTSIVCVAITFISLGVIGYCVLQKRTIEEMSLHVSEYIFSLLAVAAIMVVVWMLSVKGGRLLECLIPLACVVVLDGPFLLATPVTPRCFFGSYVFLILLLYQIMHLLPDKYKEAFNSKVVQCPIAIACVIGLIFYGYTLHQIKQQDDMRLQNIREQVAAGEKVIYVEHLENEQFVHDITLEKKWEWRGYKDFYGLPRDITIRVD